MVALLTLEAAKAHLRVETTDFDTDITRKIVQASEAVLDYCKKTIGTPDPEDHSIVDWAPDNLPGGIEAAVCLQLEKLYDDRAAGKTDNAVAMGYLTPEITALLHRWRDPALA